MILGFKTEFPWKKPTLFKEKILSGKKIHTIREDAKNRWRPFMTIHLATGVRTKAYNQFKRDFVKGIQKIEMDMGRTVKVDGRELTWDETCDLAENDGFDSVTDFWLWFAPYIPCELKIIHWTDKRY